MRGKLTLSDVKALFISLTLMACTLATEKLNAQTLFTETFESVGTTAVLPNGGWTSYDVTAGNSIWGIGASSCIITGSKSMFVCRASIANLCDYAPSSVTNKIAYKTFSSTGYNTLLLSFKWKCVGEIIGATLYDYGKVCYSTNGTTWTDLAANYQGQSATQTVTNLALPAALDNIGTVYLGFRWINDGSTKAIPGFVVDDITVTATALPGCSGAPTAGTTTSSANPACAGTSVTFSLTGATSGAGITYQWQSSPDNITYTNISGATSSTYTATISNAVWGRCHVTCTNSTLSANSTPLQQTLTPFYNCYCTATYTNGCGIDYISNVTFGSINNTSTCTGTTPSNITRYLTPNPTFYRGFTYPISVTTGGDIEGMRAWVDWNQNIAFAAGETILNGGPTTNPLTTTGSVTIPATATLGQTIMRVLCRYNTAVGTGGACNSFDYGETEDYLITIADAPGCTGTPTAGTTTSTATSACTSTSFTLSLTGASVEVGITYQWQTAPDVSGVPGTYTNVSGATAATYTTSQTSTNWYRCELVCINGGSPATSAALKVTNATCINMTNGSTTTCAGNFYDSGGQGADYGTSESFVYTFYPNAGNQTQVSWNSFISESGYDYITIYDGPSTSSPVLYGPSSGTLSIPTFTSTHGTGALTFKFTSDASVTAAGWDASITCVANPGCTGTPVASNTVASLNPACYNTAFTLSLSSSYMFSGITYQWQSAADASGSPATFSNISGATSYNYNAIQTAAAYWYRCVITCTNSSQSITSSDLKVTTQLCFCEPVYASGCVNGDRITDFLLNKLSNSTGTACSTSPAGYSVYATTPSNQTTNLVAGLTYTATITTTNTANANGTGVAIWIDYNDNGVFDVSENYNNGATKFASNSTGTMSIAVPLSAPLGQHRMRVRAMRNTNSNVIDACLAGNANGETEDYYVTIVPCDAAATATSPICQYYTQGFTSSYFGNGTPTTYVWSGPNSFASSAQNPSISNIQPADAGNYTVTITDNNGCTATATVTVSITAGPDPVAASNAPVCIGDALSLSSDNNASGQSSGNIFSWTGPNGFGSLLQNPPVTSSASAIDAGAYTVTITNAFLCTASASVTVSVNSNPAASIFSQTNVSCNGLTDASVDINASGGFPNPDYLFTDGNNFNTDGIFSGLGAGSFTVTVYDDHGCSGDVPVTITEPDVLVASAAGNGPVCAGSNINLTSSATGGTTAYGYAWSGPNSFSSSAQNPVVSPSTVLDAGVYTVLVTDANGCTDIETVTVDVASGIPASPGVVTGMPSSVCPPVTGINLSVAPVAEATSYSWVPSPGTSGVSFTTPTNGTSVTADLALVSNSTYTIRVYAINVCGTSTGYSTAFTRRAVSTPANPTGPTTACQNETKTYSIPAVTGADSYTWTGPAGSLIDGNPSPYTANVTSVNVTFPSGFSSGIVCVAANVGCFSTINKCINVSAGGIVVVGNITGSASVCPGSSYTYSVAPVAGAVSYTWILPPNTSGSSSTNSINVSIGAGFSVADIKVSATNSCGIASALKTKTISSGVPSRPASITGATNGVCSLTNAVYSCPSQAGVTFNWSIPSGSTFNSGLGTNAVSVNFGTFTTGTVCVNASNACGASADRCITVKGAPASPASVAANPSSWCANTSDIVFSANVSNVTGLYTLSWTYPPASVATYVIGGGNSNSLTLDWISGGGNVVVTASNACGNGSRSLAAASTCREEESLSVDNISIYPNPANDLVTVQFNAPKLDVAKISLSDLSGRVILSQSFDGIKGNNQVSVDLKSITKGIYIITVQNSGNNLQSRIVIE